MYYFDPHIHMVSRVTDDYETLAKMGCVGMSEPAFWAGFDRGSVDGFRDYRQEDPTLFRSSNYKCLSRHRRLRDAGKDGLRRHERAGLLGRVRPRKRRRLSRL